MSRSSAIVKPAAMVPVAENLPVLREEHETPNLLRQVHTALRGRLWLAGALAAVGVVLGGAVGYSLQEPLYRSTGVIRVQPYVPRILYESEQSGPVPMFDAFVGQQVEVIRGQRVVDHAMQDPEWHALGRGLSPEQVAAFRDHIDVTRPKGSSMIMVAFDDRDPEAAAVGTRVIVRAYERLYREEHGEGVDERIRFLENRDATLSRELRAINERMYAIANEMGSGALEQIYSFKLSELNKLESEYRRLELELAIARGDQNAAIEGGASPGGTQTADAMALYIPEIRSLLTAKRDLERQVMVEGATLGAGNRRMTTLQNQLAALEAQINEAMRTYRELGLTDPGLAGSVGTEPRMTLVELESREQNVRLLYERAKAETDELGRKSVQVELMRSEANEIKTRIDETRRRLEALTVERNLGGRVIVESVGEKPASPAKDKRHQLAAAGAFGAGGMSVGLVVLLGLVDRRIRGVADMKVASEKVRLLGVLPQLPDMTDPEQALMAAHAVHQIRTSLYGRHNFGTKPVIAVTSPSPGSGKTSFSLALGLSFAASRCRTLLIDGDFVGGGLTSKLEQQPMRRLGRILRWQGVITTQQLSEALKYCSRGRTKLGAALVKLGHATQEQVKAALEVQQDSPVGLREALMGISPTECFAPTGTRGLYIMPLGSAGPQHAGELSYPMLVDMLAQLRQWFDAIIIDTGPILGSLEASVATSAADEVVLMVARGEDRTSVERSLEHLDAVGAGLAGIVLNRAFASDIVASGYSSSMSRRSGRKPTSVEAKPFVEQSRLRLGPIGTAIAALADGPSRHSQN